MPATAAPQLPIDFLLLSVNLLDPKVAGNPEEVLKYLADYRLAPVPASHAQSSSSAPHKRSHYTVTESAQSSYTQRALSVGIEGGYGGFSGSVQAGADTEQRTSFKTIYGEFKGILDMGSLQFYRPNSPADIALGLSPDLLTALNSITTLAQAEAFTRTYGTHVVTGVQLGGTLSTVVQITSSSLSEKTTLSAQVEAAYGGVGGNLQATATAASTVATDAQSDSTSQQLVAAGGTPAGISQLDLTKADSILFWENTCSPDTVSGIFSLCEVSTLAQEPATQALLRRYVGLCILKQGLENPVIFSAATTTAPFIYNSVTATADADYRIISGGAWLGPDGNSFLTCCGPRFASNQDINGWTAVSHDCMNPADPAENLVAYAIAVYDPAGLLTVVCPSQSGQNPSTGGDTATAALPTGQTLTGGGGITSNDINFARYLTGSYPAGSPYNSWTVNCHDYGNPSAATLTVYAVGVQASDPTQMTIANTVTTMVGGRQSHGQSVAVLNGNQQVVGGGVLVSAPGGGTVSNNLLQGSFPVVDANGAAGWSEKNSDLNNLVDTVMATAYALSLQVSSPLPGVTFQPHAA